MKKRKNYLTNNKRYLINKIKRSEARNCLLNTINNGIIQDNIQLTEDIDHIRQITDYLLNVQDILEDLADRLTDDYNNSENPFIQYEEDRLVIRNILRYLDGDYDEC